MEDFDLDDFDEEEDLIFPDHSTSGPPAEDLGGFAHVRTLNTEYYTPFLKTKRLVSPINPDRLPSPAEWAKALADDEDTDYHAAIGCVFTYKPVPAKKVVPLPAGVYGHEGADRTNPERLEVITLSRKEEILPIGGTYDKVQKDVESFIANEAVYKEVKSIYKLGLLFYGSPGQGKTFFIRKLIENDFKDHIVIYLKDSVIPSRYFLSKLEEHTPDKLKVFIFEELTSNLRSWYMSWLLTFLDGESSINKSIVIATTNYPEVLPENVVLRPSRFDKLYEFGDPTPAERKIIISHFMGREALPEEIKETDNFSVASIKEVCLMVRINKLTLVQAVAELRARAKKCKSQFQKSSDKVGFV